MCARCSVNQIVIQFGRCLVCYKCFFFAFEVVNCVINTFKGMKSTNIPLSNLTLMFSFNGNFKYLFILLSQASE